MTYTMAFIFVTISPMIYLAFDGAAPFLSGMTWTHTTHTLHTHTAHTYTRACPYTRKKEIGGSLASGAGFPHAHTRARPVHTQRRD